jgi:hypothetical protein
VGCSTIEIAHADLSCAGIPSHYVSFTDEEKESTPIAVVKKFSKIVTIYKARINRQCKEVNQHNELHK